MNTAIVWVLVSLVNSGHFAHSVVPTLEFSSEEKCNAAVVKFKNEAEKRRFGTFSGYCVGIEK